MRNLSLGVYLPKVPLNYNPFYSGTNNFFLNLVLFTNLITMHSRSCFPKMATKISFISQALLQCDLDIPSSRRRVGFSTPLNLSKTCPSWWIIKYSRMTLLRYSLSWPVNFLFLFFENILLECSSCEPSCHSMRNPSYKEKLYVVVPKSQGAS